MEGRGVDMGLNVWVTKERNLVLSAWKMQDMCPGGWEVRSEGCPQAVSLTDALFLSLQGL